VPSGGLCQAFPSVTRNVSGGVVERGGKTLRHVLSEGGLVARVSPLSLETSVGGWSRGGREVVERWSRGEVGRKTLRHVSSEGGMVVAKVSPPSLETGVGGWLT